MPKIEVNKVAEILKKNQLSPAVRVAHEDHDLATPNLPRPVSVILDGINHLISELRSAAEYHSNSATTLMQQARVHQNEAEHAFRAAKAIGKLTA